MKRLAIAGVGIVTFEYTALAGRRTDRHPRRGVRADAGRGRDPSLPALDQRAGARRRA